MSEYTPYYLSADTANRYLGNTTAQNIHADMDEAAMRFADSYIDGQIGMRIPEDNSFFGTAVGIAYLLYKVQRQQGKDTEKVRKLDWDIATAALNKLEENLKASGSLPSASLIDTLGTSGGTEYETSPLNEKGIVVLGSKTIHGVTTTNPTRIVTTPQDE